MFRNHKDVDTIVGALGEHLEVLAEEPIELLVCGGSALNALRLVQRTTKDVDVLAYVKRGEGGALLLLRAEPLSETLIQASQKVARDFNLPENWINTGPTSAVDFGLPEAIMERVTTRHYGRKLIVHFVGRYDQIHFKLYASADQGAGKHLDDLIALNPTSEELERAARWSMTHDVSDGYREGLKALLRHIGHNNVAERL